MDSLAEKDIKVGHTYRAKRFKETPWMTNDRTIMWISSDRTQIQYDSDTVKIGMHLPTIPMEKFLNWVKEDVTDK